MPKDPKFEVVKHKNGKWMVNVPAAYSETGKRSQPTFKTRNDGQEFAKALKENHKAFGLQSKTLSAEDSIDAAKALKLLINHDVNLTQCAKFYVQHHDRRAKAPKFGELMGQFIDLKDKAKKSAKYLKGLRNLHNRLPKDFAETNIVDLAGQDIEHAIDQMTDGDTAKESIFTRFRAVLNYAIKAEFLEKNPCIQVFRWDRKPTKEVELYTPDEARSLFSACKDYEDGKDRKCSECAVPFAFLAFAGIRPTELERLKWGNVRLENKHIRIGASVSKTNHTRNIPINDTLAAWIETVPVDEREGSIIPSRWKQKATRVRKEAKLDGRRLQDALRHSYGSYLLVMGDSENDRYKLHSAMGHQHAETFYNHYHNATTREVAEKFWRILPEST